MKPSRRRLPRRSANTMETMTDMRPRRAARPLPRVVAAAAALGAMVLLGACTQEADSSATRPKVSAVIPDGATTTVAGATTTGGPTTIAIDSRIKTIDDVRSTLTADGILDFDQADCIVNNLRGVMPDTDIVNTFAIADLTKVATDRSAAVVKAFSSCVPKEAIMMPLAKGVQQAATTRGVTVSDTEVDCIAKQLAATVTYEDMLLVPADGEGGLSNASATKAVQACVTAEAFAALGIA